MVTEKIVLVVKNLVYKIIPGFAYFALPVYPEESRELSPIVYCTATASLEARYSMHLSLNSGLLKMP